MKWYISTLIITLIFLGVVSQKQTTMPNQEIVLHFTDVETTSDDVQYAIANLKEQLHILGVDNIYVKEGESGKLKITYYSTKDVASIKKVLSKEQNLEFTGLAKNQDQNKFPSKDSSVNYDLDVHEILKGHDSYSNTEGYALESKSENRSTFNSNLYLFKIEIEDKKKEEGVKEAYRVCRNIAIAINNIAYAIPEVRAGPSLSILKV
ncbi:hypothetical protein [Flavivirga aquatica]|uniref:hypothetical protein n=1 Tax=Flavivirga aquatica TaxID=1849968 RepID=UPI0013F4ED31|nr:hypothetical protein [Flavivirga aquatica]